MIDQTITPEAPETTETSKSLGQTYYEEVEALRASGTPNASAVRQVAAKHDKPVSSVRGGIFQYKSRHVEGGDSPAPRGRNGHKPQSVDDCIGQARASLESALRMIDTEVDTARVSFESAKAHYEQVQASVKDRKADIEKKLKALS